jgi:hypothetical protein
MELVSHDRRHGGAVLDQANDPAWAAPMQHKQNPRLEIFVLAIVSSAFAITDYARWLDQSPMKVGRPALSCDSAVNPADNNRDQYLQFLIGPKSLPIRADGDFIKDTYLKLTFHKSFSNPRNSRYRSQ